MSDHRIERIEQIVHSDLAGIKCDVCCRIHSFDVPVETHENAPCYGLKPEAVGWHMVVRPGTNWRRDICPDCTGKLIRDMEKAR